jgi:hypothetical protein
MDDKVIHKNLGLGTKISCFVKIQTKMPNSQGNFKHMFNRDQVFATYGVHDFNQHWDYI